MVTTYSLNKCYYDLSITNCKNLETQYDLWYINNYKIDYGGINGNSSQEKRRIHSRYNR